jgi:sodium transport system permease protein
MVKTREVTTIYLAELKMALRDRTILTNSILIPIFLYPLILWLAFTGITFVQGQTEGIVSRLAVAGLSSGHAALRSSIERDEHIKLEDLPAAEAIRQIRSGELDLLLELLPATGRAAVLPDNFSVRLTLDSAKERSVAARDRLKSLLDTYRERLLKREAASHGVTPEHWASFTITLRNVASEKQMGAFILSLLLPLLFVIMVAIGCFHPAVDATAGERERNTWETLMSTAAGRPSIVVAKYLYVATFGCLAGLLNMTAMVISMKPMLAPLLARSGEHLEFTIPLVALPVMALGGVLLAAFVAAGMMIFAAFARTFKEGQSMITPFYMIILLPAMFLQVPGITFSLPLAFIPVVNLTMMVREAISGVFHPREIAISIVISLGLIAGLLRLATVILRFEDVVMGSYGGSFNTFFKQRLLGRKPAASPAVGAS